MKAGNKSLENSLHNSQYTLNSPAINIVRPKYKMRVRQPWITESFGVDDQAGRGGCRLSEETLGGTLEDTVVLPRLHRLNSQHRPVGHVDDRVPGSIALDPSAPPPPVDVRCRISGRLAEEADGSVFGDLLIARCECYLGHICRLWTENVRDLFSTRAFSTRLIVIIILIFFFVI